MQYRRVLDSGACYFFILTLEDRNKEYLTQYIDLLRSAYSKVIKRYPVETIAIVIMPDHLHALWQRRYWEHKIRDDNDLQNHINYIHYNPVKHKYVNSGTLAVDWGIDAVNISVDAE